MQAAQGLAHLIYRKERPSNQITTLEVCSMITGKTTVAQSTMKDRLVELQKVRAVPMGPSSATWHDQLVKRMNGHASKENLVPDSPEIKPRFFRHKSLNIKAENRKIDTFVSNLQEKVLNIKSEVSQIQSNTREIRALHTKDLLVPGLGPSEKQQMADVDKNTRGTNSRILKLLKELEDMKVPDNAAVQRIHSVQLSQVLSSFKAAVGAYEAELERYAKALRQQVTKQIAIARRSGASSESGVGTDHSQSGKVQIFVDNYLATELEARTQLQDVQDRHRELVALEESIVEVRDLFAQVAVLVMTQGDMVDNIEAHVEAANAQVSKGSKDVASARKKQRSSRKKKAILASVGAAVATGLIATVIFL